MSLAACQVTPPVSPAGKETVMTIAQSAPTKLHRRQNYARLLTAVLLGLSVTAAVGQAEDSASRRRNDQGLAIAPVPLDIAPRKRRIVGLGSYIVNAQSACADCHSCPTYAPGHNPFMGGDGQLNASTYLAGGVPFGPFTSSNITPDENGDPAGLSEAEFVELIRTGHDPDGPPGTVLQVMPWPILRHMTDNDLRAIYEYLRSIPHAETPAAGTCAAPGQ
jgi:hypothetical protein